MLRAKVDNPLFARTDKPESTLKVLNSKILKLSKFKTFKEQLLVRLRTDHLDYLTRLESSIMKGRSSGNKKERITKNSIVRVAIDAIHSLEINEREIPNEETLLERIQQAIKKQAEDSLKV